MKAKSIKSPAKQADVSKLLNKDEYLKVTFERQRTQLCFVAGVGDDTSFSLQTKRKSVKFHGNDSITFKLQVME